MKEYYVYEWYVIETDEVFYIGKGKNKRAENIQNRNKFFKDMYNSHNCNFRIKIDNLTEEEAFKYEKLLIEYYREYYPQYRLTNQTDGGEGVSGWHPSKEIKERISKSVKEIWENDDYRNKMIKLRNEKDSVYQSEEFRKKISKLVKGENNPNYGHYWTNEMKEKARKDKLGKYEGENNPNYGNKWNDEQRRHLSEIRKNGDLRDGNHGMAKKVICLETCEIFDCIKQAKQKYNSLSILSHKRVSIKGYHIKEINDNYIPDKEILFEELLNFYRNIDYPRKIFLCKENRTFYFGYPDLQKETGLGICKIKTLFKKYNEIKINNKTYIIIKE